jgi:hypothetical protein
MATVKFLSGDKDNIMPGIQNGTIKEGSILITEDTNEMAVVNESKDVNFIRSRTQQAYTLNGTSIGALSNGAVIPAGTSIDELLNMIVAQIKDIIKQADVSNDTECQLRMKHLISEIKNALKN